MKPRPRSSAVLGALALWLATSSASAQPAEDELRARQVAYAKQMHAEGVRALGRKQYTLAVARFEEAYRYAPDKHVFNFNIAEAAHAAGDCVKARHHYLRFTELVPDHTEREAATAKLQQIDTSACAQAPEEAPQLAADANLPEAIKRERKLLHTALAALRTSQALLHKNGARHGKRPFAAIARQQRRDERKLVDLIAALDHPVPERSWGAQGLLDSGTRQDACDKSKQQLESWLEALTGARAQYRGGRAYRILGRLERRAKRDMAELLACS